MRHLKIETENWPVAGEFRISGSALTEITVVTVSLSDGEHQGRGECRPYAKYKETAQSVTAQIESMRNDIEHGLSIQALQDALAAGAARNAIDCALWDLAAKQSGKPVSSLLGLKPPAPRQTAFTLSIDSPDNMRRAAIGASGYPLLKIKIGGVEGLEACLAVMDVRPDVQLIIDANEALSPDEVKNFRDSLIGRPVALIEQPLAREAYDAIPHEPDVKPVFCADESLHTVRDLDRLWQAGYRSVNVKLDKCGGLTAGLELMRAAKEKGFTVMAGCMVGTSLAMAPMMLLEGFADYIDLDGPLLLAKDRAGGLHYDGPIIHPASRDFWG